MSELTENINCISSFLAERDVPGLSVDAFNGEVDLAVLLGNSLIGSIYTATNVIKSRIAQKLLISGGIGH